MCEISLNSQLFSLLPQKALHWQQKDVLAIADLHIGKPETFQKYGFAVPSAPVYEDLKRMSELIREKNPKKVLLLGDIFHGPDGVSDDVVVKLVCIRKSFSGDMLCIGGNHDLYVQRQLSSRDLDWINEKLIIGKCLFSHRPVPAGGRVNVCGHLHPCIRIRHGQESIKLPCFAVKKDTIVLPSFGTFTGCNEIVPKTGETYYAIAENSVVHVPNGLIQPR